MAANGEPVYYSPLPPEPSAYHQNNPRYQQQQQPPPPPPQGQHYVLLPLYQKRPSRFRSLRFPLLCGASLVLLCLAIFFIWPSDPHISVVRLRIDHFRVHTSPLISFDISMPITIKIRNPDFFSLDYRSLVVAIGYRGKQLGFVTSNGGHLRARGSSYTNAMLQLQGIRVYDVFHLLEDFARGSIPFETVTQLRGRLGLFFFDFPLKAKVSCKVIVDIHNQTIVRQNCYPE